ncbi:MAG: hypothetical protein HUK20_09230 [Fibrobacter sp.]|nr:hypothetical protein [Fibrobacter sp.]
MKKLLISAISAAMLSACAGLLGGGNPEVTNLEQTSTIMAANFVNAHMETTIAFVNALEAVDNKTAAEKIKAEAEGLRDEENNDKLEESMNSLNEIDLSAELNQAGELSAEGKAKLANSILHLGIAIYFDARVAAQAPDVVSQAKNISANLSASDAMAAGKVKNIINNAGFIADVAPDQLSKLKDTFSSLKAYADAHGIKVPSQQEIEAQAAEMERE